MLSVEVDNRSGVEVDEGAAVELASRVLAAEGIGFVRFSNLDVVRHKLVQRIVEAYKRHAEETGSARDR